MHFLCFQKYCFRLAEVIYQNIKSENYTWKSSTLLEVISTSIGQNALTLFKFFCNILSFKSGKNVGIAVTKSTPVNIRMAVSSKMVIIKISGRVRKWRIITNRWKYRNIIVNTKRKGLFGLVTSYVGTAFLTTLLKEILKGM